MSATRRAIDFARANAGIITTHEAAALGLTKAMLSRRLVDGIFVRLGHGVMALPGTATTSDLMLNAVCRTAGAVVSHQSAARIHGFRPIPDSPPTVTVAHRNTHELLGVRVHQSTDLADAHTMDINGMRVTTPARTIIDLAQVMGAQRLERVFEHALVEELVEYATVEQLFSAVARRGKRGVTNMRKALGALSPEVTVSDSVLESQFMRIVREAGLPVPTPQFHAPWLRPSNGRVDFGFLDERIVVEVDGRRWHSHRDAFEEDRRRDNAAQLAGWMVLRFTWRMIDEAPSRVVADVRQALANRNGRT